MNIRNRLKEKPNLHTGALNDILFIFLLFFLVVATLGNPNIIKVNTPKGKSDSKAKQNIVVSINQENQIYIGQKPIDIAAIDSILKIEIGALKAYVDTPTVSINADTISYTGSFIKVLTAAKKAGARVVANIAAN